MCGSTVECWLRRMVWFGLVVGGVLANLEEVEEVGNEHKFSGWFCSWVGRLLGCELDVAWECQEDGKFCLWCGIFLGVGIQELLELCMNSLSECE